jgi:hypothetical protein
MFSGHLCLRAAWDCSMPFIILLPDQGLSLVAACTALSVAGSIGGAASPTLKSQEERLRRLEKLDKKSTHS